MMRFSPLACFLLVILLCTRGLAQEQKLILTPTQIPFPFPLPTRAMRLMQEARDPETPISRLLEMLTPENTPLHRAVLEVLGERANADVLPALEKLLTLVTSNGELTSTIRKIRVRQGLETVPKIDAEAEIAYLQAHPISEWKEDDWDNNAVRGTVETLTGLVELGDKRALPFVQEFALRVKPHMVELENPLANDLDLSQRAYHLEMESWKLRLRELSLEQKVTLFKSSDSMQTPYVFEGLDEALQDVGSPLFPLLAEIVPDKTASSTLRYRAVSMLYWIRDPGTTDVFLRALNDRTVSKDMREFMLDFLALSGHPRSVMVTLKSLALKQGVETADNWEQVTPELWRVSTLAKVGVDKQLLENAILPYLESGSSTAVSVVCEVGSDKSVDALLAIVKETKVPTEESRMMVRRAALGALGVIGQRIEDKDGRLQAILLELYRDKNFPTRIFALAALAHMGKSQEIPVLLDLARNEKDSSALSFEISGIYLAGGDEAVKALKEIKQLAQARQNAAIVELTEEGLMRLNQEKRMGQIEQPVALAH
ncbi:hypothetical protein IAD21_04539 [Abditibacteriota bacterium]|nr:hypothetical protein IAD21_04539 [Abditibacteriota bacterium]